jgi:hypothetical protein
MPGFTTVRADVPRETVAAIVSALAKNFPADRIARDNHVTPLIVNELRIEYGPGMGELATNAEVLRTPAVVNGKAPSLVVPLVTPLTIPTTVPEDIAALLVKAAMLPSLAAKAAKVESLLNFIRSEIDAAEKAEKLRAVVARHRAAIAEAEQQLTDLRGNNRSHHPGPTGEAAQIRTWAKENGVECPTFGRVPQSVVDLWKAAQK